MPFQSKVEGNDYFKQLNAVVLQILDAQTAFDLTVILRRFNALVGAYGSVFTLKRVGDDAQSMKCIVACPMSWIHQYHARHWSLNDPALIYSELNSEPILIADLEYGSAGQKEILKAATAARLNSGVVIPVHSSMGRSKMGVLQVWSDDPDYFTVQSMNVGQSMLRAVAAEMLDWFERDSRKSLRQKLGATLKESDTELLRLIREGMTSKEIARLLGITKDTVDQRLSRVCQKFNVSSREKAASMAYEAGLL